MKTNCSYCGKQYQIDTSFIKGESAWFSCKGCGERIVVHRETKAANNGAYVQDHPARAPSAPSEPPPAENSEALSAAVDQAAASYENKRGRLGLRFKMTLLFLVVPIALMAGASFVYLKELKGLSGLLTAESSQVVTKLAANIIQEKARSVAKQLRLYLDNHPGLKEADFSRDPGLREVAIQSVGQTGYTVIYERGNAKGEWPIWGHPSAKVVGVDTLKLEKPLGKKNFAGLWGVVSASKDGAESQGYYGWQEADGSIRQKFMATAPIANTPYSVASTTYVDEFTKPIQDLQARAGDITDRISQYAIGALVVTLVLVGTIVMVYAVRLTGQISALTRHAERISAGDLESTVDVKSKDEIGELAHAISLMQTSIRLSISRLRRRAS